MHDYFNGDTATARKYGENYGWAQERYMPLIRDKYALDPDKIPFDFDEVIASIARGILFQFALNDANFNLSGIKRNSQYRTGIQLHESARQSPGTLSRQRARFSFPGQVAGLSFY